MPTNIEEQLKNLKAAYNSGVLLVRVADSEVRYRSREEMLAIIQNLEKESYGKTISPHANAYYPTTSKGL